MLQPGARAEPMFMQSLLDMVRPQSCTGVSWKASVLG
jgi:hypothetical protein